MFDLLNKRKLVLKNDEKKIGNVADLIHSLES